MDPFPSFPLAPIATLNPSEDKETAQPLWSSAASPSISSPIRAAVGEPTPPIILVITSFEMEVPDIEIVGVAVIASLKFAVMVTVSDAANKSSSSVSERVTVGAVVSGIIVNEVVLEPK